MAQVNTNRKHGLFLHEQLIHLHTENTQMKLQTYSSMKILWKMITCLLRYGITSLVTGYSHNAFFFISGAKYKNNLRGYIAFKGNTINFSF